MRHAVVWVMIKDSVRCMVAMEGLRSRGGGGGGGVGGGGGGG